jgi:signal transduction histidine kinase/DNA-binding response OmpR family regulator/integral membrane sensor domain MASE1
MSQPGLTTADCGTSDTGAARDQEFRWRRAFLGYSYFLQDNTSRPMSAGRPPQSSVDARGRATLAAIALLALCYYLAARAGLLLAFNQSNATPVWPPSGIAFGALLLLGYRIWPGVLLGAFLANVATFSANGLPVDGQVLAVSLAIAVGNTLEALTGAALMRRFAGGPHPLGQLHTVYKFALIAMAMCLVSAGIGSLALLLGGLIPSAAYSTVIATWWVGDTAGVLVVAPAMLAWRPARPPRMRMSMLLEVALSLLLLVALIGAVFGQRYSTDAAMHWLAYLFVLVIGWSSFRFGLRGTSLVCLLTAGGAVLGTTRGLGPFSAGTLNDALISLESFVMLCSVIGMILCADASERDRLREIRQDGILPQWATLFAGIGLTILVWHLLTVSTERRAREQFQADCTAIQQRVGRRLAQYETALRSAQALFKATGTVSRTQWRDFVAGIDVARHFPGMQGMGYARYVAGPARAALEQAVHAEGYPGFHLWPQPAPGAASATVLYLEPFSGRNLRAFGYDMLSEPSRRTAMLLAARGGEAAMTGKVKLVQEDGSDEQAGFLAYLPVYANGAPAATPAQRMAALQGFAYSAFRVDDLMRGILGAPDSELQLEIFDGDGTAAGAHLHSSGQRSASEISQYPNPYVTTLALDLMKHRWTMRFTSLPAFENQIDRQKSHIVLLAGTIISLLFFGVVRALTARQAYAQALAEDMTGALRESESSLILARDQAEAASRAKTEFVANMSHEIRTPLNAVLGMTHLLSNTALSPDQQKYLEMIRMSGNSLLSILNDVLDFSKIEAGRMELAPAPFQLASVLEAVATIMTVNAGEKDLELAIGVQPDVPAALLGDGHRLQQVLVNLVGNAIKFTEAGAVTVLVERIAPAIPEAQQQLRFSVRDTGIGIAPELVSQLFAPFSQADASMTRRFGGTGLGLVISRRLAALMGGQIDVRSAAGAGSEFALTVPLATAPDSAAATGAGPLRLLVVDDHALSADYLCRTVRAQGWQADCAADGPAALALLAQPDAAYDAALVDWKMPGMDGLAAMGAMRSTAAGGRLAIVLMVSAFGQGTLLHADGAHMADAVLLKPVSPGRLGDTVRLAMSARAARVMQAARAPVAEAAPVAADAPAAADSASEAPRLDGVRLLLVEDNPINQLVARSMLDFAGASIDAVDNGKAAVERLGQSGAQYDLVLMDVQMPEMDGFEATRRIRADLGLTLPILAMTAGVMSSEREQCIACGMNDFIAKPIDVDDMLRTIARNLPSKSRLDY